MGDDNIRTIEVRDGR